MARLAVEFPLFIRVFLKLIGEVSLICYFIMFRVGLSIRKSDVCAYGCVLRSWLTEEYQAVNNKDLIKKHRFEFDEYILSFMDCK